MTPDRKSALRQVDVVDQINDYSFKRYKILRAILRYRRSDGRMSAPVERICFDAGDAVAVLLYDSTNREVILVRQFRYPAWVSLAAENRRSDAGERSWVLEIVAGVQEKGEAVEDVARRETLEETGYTISALERIAQVYTTPGSCSERITIYLGEVDHRTPRASGGGVANEGEDTEVVTLPLEKAISMVERGEIADAKTVITLQHLALRLRGTIETTDEHR